MTYGQIRLFLTKLATGADPELLDGWIQHCYTEILDLLPWQRLESEISLQVPASYTAGTVAATQGSTAIVGTGTTWTSTMTGRFIRIANAGEYYRFTYVSATTGTLERAFEQPNLTGQSYRIDQAIFPLPATARIVRGVRPLHNVGSGMEMVTPGTFNRVYPNRGTYGTPEWWSASFDEGDPPALTLELYPIPDCPDAGGATLSFFVDVISDRADLNPAQTSVSLLPWVKPGALTEGVQARIARWRASAEKNTAFLAIAEAHEKKFAGLVAEMAQINALERGPQPMRLARELRRRGTPYYRRGPRHPGYTG